MDKQSKPYPAFKNDIIEVIFISNIPSQSTEIFYSDIFQK